MAVPRVNLLQGARLWRRDPIGALSLVPEAEVVATWPPLPVRIVNGPDAARDVLVRHAADYRRPWIVRSIMGDALGQNLFLAEGDEWLSRRRPVGGTLAHDRMDDLAALIASAVDASVSRWTAGRLDDAHVEMTNITMQVACQALLGLPADSPLADAIRSDFEAVLAWMARRFSRPGSAPLAVPTRRNRAVSRSQRNLRATLAELVDQRRACPTPNGTDVLSRLVVAQDPALSDEELVDECVGLLFAGHETTAAVLTWSLYELATHPDVQARLAAEADRRPPDAAPNTLIYTRRVVDEVLRLHPAAVAIPRTARRSTTVAGERVRRGTIVAISVYTMQRSGRGWPAPETFDPERAQADDERLDYYLPFGAGSRRCLGARLAVTELTIALSIICSRWQLAYREASPPRPKVMPSLRMDGPLTLRITSR